MKSLLIVALLSVGMAVPATAQPAEIVVKLSSADRVSAKSVKRRIGSAIEQLCGGYATVEHYQWLGIDQCRAAAWASANRQIASLNERNVIRLTAR